MKILPGITEINSAIVYYQGNAPFDHLANGITIELPSYSKEEFDETMRENTRLKIKELYQWLVDANVSYVLFNDEKF